MDENKRREFEEKETALVAAYDAAMKKSLDAYDAATDQHWAAYEAALTALRKEYGVED